MALTSVAAHAGITIKSPTTTTVSSTTTVSASATPDSSSYRISYMSIVVNSTKVAGAYASSISKSVSLRSGYTNRVQVKAWDTSGKTYEKVLSLTVGSTTTSGGTTTTSGGKTYSNIDQMSGWGSCDECAGKDADGPSATHWMKQNVSSPSMDGRSVQFFLGGSTPYSNALWHKQLTRDATTIRAARNFVYDIYFYYTNKTAAQGLEFNISQYIDGKAYIYGTQCNIRSGSGPHWDISVPRDYSKPLTTTNMKWQNTGISCVPSTYKWNRVTIEFQRTSDNKVRFISISLNGSKRYVNVTVPPRISPDGWQGLNVHYQMNGNYVQTDYSTWVDKFSLKTW
jgi:hypothetical protein